LIFLRSILEDLWYFAMIESIKMNKSWLSHQAVDGKEISMSVYGIRMNYFGFVQSPQECGERREGKKTILLGHLLCVRPFWGLLLVYFLKSL